MAFKVRGELYVKAPDVLTCDKRSQRYVESTGLRRVESRGLQREGDWTDASFKRYSEDNGRTWGEWTDVSGGGGGCEKLGDDEIKVYHGKGIYNPHHGHFVELGMRRVLFGGHNKAYNRIWAGDGAGFCQHSLLSVRKDGAHDSKTSMIKYEDGADYCPERRSDPAFTDRNQAYRGNGVDVAENGDIIFPIAADLSSCRRILGIDVRDVFPSCPKIMKGMIVVRGRFNESRGEYNLSFSRPVVISDLKSSRGVDEPDAAVLPSGRILVVFRGSNVESEAWNTRIEPGTPAHKWYCWSDDGGETFTDPVPWHYDDREVFYSSASIAKFVRSERSGKLYWIGNISGYETYGGYPRYPLVIAEVNGRGLLIKDSLTIIDTRGENDGENVQLSNFKTLQDRETGLLEIYLAKLGQRPEHKWHADCYRYFVDIEAKE